MRAMSSFLESVELAEDFTSESSRAASLHSPRISFSNEFAQINPLPPPACSSPHPFHKPSTSGEFEFTMNSAVAAATPVRNHPPMLSADELFYKGKLLPLHLPPRIRMVQDLEVQEENSSKRNQRGGGESVSKTLPVGVMRRERSLRSPARPSLIASTLKSSSYPPPGYSSRPSSPPKSTKCTSAGSSTSSRWRDLFGLKKISSPRASSSSSSSSSSSGPSKLLKMIFNRNSGSSSSSSSSSSAMNPNLTLHFPENPDHGASESSSTANNEAQPLLRDSSHSSSDHPELPNSSSSASSSSNWGSSSASSSSASSSSFSAEFPDIPDSSGPPGISRKSDSVSRLVTSRNRGGGGGAGPPNPARSRAAGARGKQSGPNPPQSVKNSSLQRSGSNRRSSPATNPKMQLQDHVLIGNTNPTNNHKPRSHSESSWRRPVDHHQHHHHHHLHHQHHKPGGGGGGGGGVGGVGGVASNPSSVRVTPVLHVPACIGPSLRSVRVHGLKRLFSSSSASNAPGKTQAVM